MARENKVCTSIGYLTGEKEFKVREVKLIVKRRQRRGKLKDYFKRTIRV